MSIGVKKVQKDNHSTSKVMYNIYVDEESSIYVYEPKSKQQSIV